MMTMMNTSEFNKKYKIKEYLISTLLDQKEEIEKRCTLVENLSIKFDFLPETRYLKFQKKLIYKQTYIKKIRTDSLSYHQLKFYIKKFAKNLDELSKYNFVHGDINISNVVFDGSKFNLIDFEPSFFHLKNGKKILKSATNIRSKNDKLFNTITSETDKIGFYYYAKKVFFDLGCNNQKFTYNDPYLLKNEDLILKKSYLEIAEIYFNNI